MFEVFLNNPAWGAQFNTLGVAQGALAGWAEVNEPVVPNPNIPQFITERVDGVSATVDGGNLIIIEGSGSVSAIYPAYSWQKAVKVQPQRNVE